MSKIIVIGAGIVGLSVAHELATRGHHVTVLEKEKSESHHQTGNNSGVIHSGLYYKPGSQKAILSVSGSKSMRAFAQQHDVPFENCGKLVVASNKAELAQLNALHKRATQNGVPCRVISAGEAKEYEPHVAAFGALRVESTSIVDYRSVSRVLVDLIREYGGEVLFEHKVTAIDSRGAEVRVSTTRSEISGAYLVNCAGLYSDRIARLAGIQPDVRIIPFRGEYFEFSAEKRDLVRSLIYPVPDPRFPFLGVHLTKMIDGGVHAGPNAVFAFAREGYRWRDVNIRDLWDSATWPGLWKLAASFSAIALEETERSLSRKKFADSLQKLVPEIKASDLSPAPAGVRAQAMRRDGSLVDDFHYQIAHRQIHVLNAPSPAATASLEIGKHVANRIESSL